MVVRRPDVHLLVRGHHHVLDSQPIKKALFIDFYNVGGHTFDLFGWGLSGPQAEMIAKTGNMVAVFFAAVVFTWLARTLRRSSSPTSSPHSALCFS